MKAQDGNIIAVGKLARPYGTEYWFPVIEIIGDRVTMRGTEREFTEPARDIMQVSDKRGVRYPPLQSWEWARLLQLAMDGISTKDPAQNEQDSLIVSAAQQWLIDNGQMSRTSENEK